MLTIQKLLKNAHFCINNLIKRLYRSCAVLVSGFTVFALVFINDQELHGADKSGIAAERRNVRELKEEWETEGEGPVPSQKGFCIACRSFLEGSPGRIREEIQAEISKREVTTVCASIEPARNELKQEPINPYGEIAVTEQDYEALCRIVQAEAGGEDGEGKILVAEVILNRVLSDKFASTVYDVIFERSGGSPQFSPTMDGRYYSVSVEEETVTAVEQALHGKDISQGALFFSARSKADPYDMAWFDRNLEWLFCHGGHEFYTLP